MAPAKKAPAKPAAPPASTQAQGLAKILVEALQHATPTNLREPFHRAKFQELIAHYADWVWAGSPEGAAPAEPGQEDEE